MASQVQQVFYVEDPVEKMMYNVITKLPRGWCDIEDENEGQDQDEVILVNANLGAEMENQDKEASSSRDDVPTNQVLIETDAVQEPA